MTFLPTRRGTIQIMGATYDLPRLPKEIGSLREEISNQSKIVESGQNTEHQLCRRVYRRKPIWGVISRKPLIKVVTPEPRELGERERMEHLDRLVGCYDDIIDCLEVSKEDHLSFFNELTKGIRSAVEVAVFHIRETEKKRQELERASCELQDVKLIERSRMNRERLIQSVRFMAHSVLLLLRKIELYTEGITALAEDQLKQQKVLNRCKERLKIQRKMFELENDIEQIEREIEQMVHAALHFEDYVKDYLGPLQSLLDEVNQIDDRLHRTVLEIETLTQSLTEQQIGAVPIREDDERILDFLIASNLKQERLRDVLEDIDSLEPDVDEIDIRLATEEVSLDNALSNIEQMVQIRFDGLLSKNQDIFPLDRKISDSPTPARRLSVNSRDTISSRTCAPLEDSGIAVDNLDGVNLRKANLRRGYFQKGSLNYAHFDGADLCGANFNWAQLRQAQFEGADLSQAFFNNAFLWRANLNSARLFQANFDAAFLIDASCDGADLSRASLIGANLRGTRFTRAALDGALLTGALYDGLTRWPKEYEPVGALFIGPGCDMSNLDLSRASFHNADLKRANFSNSLLKSADFSNADLWFADFRGADLSDANLKGALSDQLYYDSMTKWPEGGKPTGAILISPGGDFSGASFAKINLKNSDLHNSNFSRSNLSFADLEGTNLAEADLTEADLRGASLQGANLHRALLNNANLRDASLEAADLRGVNMLGARLEGVRLTSIQYDGETTWPEGFILDRLV